MAANIDQVREFWEAHPLWTGESAFAPGSREFFDEHRSVIINDGFAGELDRRIMPRLENRDSVLDLGCGPGFWTVELARLGCARITAADLTESALELARKRSAVYGVEVAFSRENAEHLTFPDGSFSHVNCQGVVHHTPDTDACIREIHRVLRPNGTASISVYFRNVFLRCWPLLRPAGSLLVRIGGGLHGRGRDTMLLQRDAGELVRQFDGRENPVGKSYSRRDLVRMTKPYFVMEEAFLHFFPARALPIRMPAAMHRFLDRHAGFLIYTNLRKK